MRHDSKAGGTVSFFSVVRANVAREAGDREDEFVTWWAEEHQPEFLAVDGFRRAWLLDHEDHPHAFGEPGQRYAAIYDVDTIDDFHRALDAGPPWGEWQQYVDDWLLDWGRTYRKVLTEQRGAPGHGPFWAVVESDFDLADDSEREELNSWYNDTHLPELLANPGFHRAWRLEIELDDRDLGPRGHRYWAIYEVAHPDDLARARERRQERGIEPWDGIWGNKLTSWSIHFFKILNRLGRN
jgi:hypothetical protein